MNILSRMEETQQEIQKVAEDLERMNKRPNERVQHQSTDTRRQNENLEKALGTGTWNFACELAEDRSETEDAFGAIRQDFVNFRQETYRNKNILSSIAGEKVAKIQGAD
jgi:phage shock protein A